MHATVDRQVILGNHRDAWVFGGADPNSGTATLLALAKVMGQLRKNGMYVCMYVCM